jgi:hypothetical protein
MGWTNETVAEEIKKFNDFLYERAVEHQRRRIAEDRELEIYKKLPYEMRVKVLQHFLKIKVDGEPSD